ncbi:hypothetical protein TPCCA_0183 [Treponema paraluiscuniculi Cuniculi A]|uniref:Uncharacterized protein n=2 Tax=Treponema paraluiscuniculi TaxID=53435 RepID=F7XS14_TREPU|nr:hypothetical protein [Treponema paraluiscuniculi]AEH40133.1 hypothetical protein TPCCA_0183 [Treponema paraluiscuniculi Cuniculi A]WKC72067.1 hypothetical protein TPLL2_0183 [Treponema paraluiscuniculi]
MEKGIRSSRLLILFVLFAHAVHAAPRVGVYRLEVSGVPAHTETTINDALFSFIRELRGYHVVDCREQAVPHRFPEKGSLDYIFCGAMNLTPEGIRLAVALKGKDHNATRLLSKTYETAARILLDSRHLVRDVFDRSVPLTGNQTKTSGMRHTRAGEESISSLDALAGSWHSTEEEERIVIVSEGRGIAVLRSGLSVPLKLKISDGVLVVSQKGAVNARQFSHFPPEIAQKLAQEARPLQWRFTKISGNNRLSGVRTAPVVRGAGHTASVEYEEVPEEWVRN